MLTKNYEHVPEVVCENIAIADKPGVKSLFVVRESYRNSANWKRLTGIASFRKEVITKSLRRKIPRGASPDDYIEELPIRCDTLSGAIKRAHLEKVDIYQIDCEGYDYEIIKQIDFSQKPSIINYESLHLSPEDRDECLELLKKHGYRWFNHGGCDTCAYLVDIAPTA